MDMTWTHPHWKIAIYLPSLALVLISPVNIMATDDCKCVSAAPSETTRWGGNREMVVIEEQETYRAMRGEVIDWSGAKIPNVLVEVFDHPEGLLLDYPQRKEAQLKQRRIAACKTGAAGRFCFSGLPKGTYELRCSIGSGWDVTHFYVQIGKIPGKATKRELKVEMHLGD
jgi:hypothetical protein